MNKSRTISTAVLSIMMAACSSKPAASQDHVEQANHANHVSQHTAPVARKLPAAESPPVPLDCTGADAKQARCVAFAELEIAHRFLNAYAADISISLLTSEISHGRTGGLSKVEKGAADAAKDHPRNALAALVGENDADIQAAHDAIEGCVEIVDKVKKLSREDFDLRRDECTVRSARLLQSARLADHVLGVRDTPDFNKLHWGDSVDVVLRAMGGTPSSKSNSTLTYHQMLGAHPVLLALHFTNGKLTRADYWLNDIHSEASAYLDDFDDVDTLLIGKYGKPLSSEMSWRNDLFKGDPSHYGLALSSGQLRKDSQWILDAMKITHAVYGDNFKVTHGIEYTSTEYAWEVRQAERTKASSTL